MLGLGSSNLSWFLLRKQNNSKHPDHILPSLRHPIQGTSLQCRYTSCNKTHLTKGRAPGTLSSHSWNKKHHPCYVSFGWKLVLICDHAAIQCISPIPLNIRTHSLIYLYVWYCHISEQLSEDFLIMILLDFIISFKSYERSQSISEDILFLMVLYCDF